MKEYSCGKCGSKDLFIKEKSNNAMLYCGDCGAYIKGLSKTEKELAERFIKTREDCNMKKNAKEMKEMLEIRLSETTGSVTLRRNSVRLLIAILNEYEK